MQDTVPCPSCQRDLRVPEELLGRAVKCPACGSTFTAEASGTAAVPSSKDQSVPPVSLSPSAETNDRAIKEPWEEEYHSPVRLDRSLRQDALRQIKAPANALFSAGIVGCVACTLFIVVHGVMFWIAMRQNREFQGEIHIGGPMMGQAGELQYILVSAGILVETIGIGLGIIVILGSRKMKKLMAYRFAMISSILSILMAFPLASPLSSCCLLGVLFGMWTVAAGIWSIVVLCKPEVKEAFS